MTEDRNVFESLDSIIAMVTDSGEDLTADRIKYLYNAFLSAIDEAKKEDEFYRDKFINEWNIQYRKSPARYRANQDIMFDLAGLWLRSNNAIRDEICKMAIGVSDDNKDFYRIMDSYHFEMYRAVISDEEKDSIFSSVDALNNALDNAIEKDCQRPSHDTLAVVYKYIAFGYASIYMLQSFLNIGGVTKFIPSTGVTLPLVSYGVSSVLSTLIVFSIIQGVCVISNKEAAKNEKEKERIRAIKQQYEYNAAYNPYGQG